MANSEDKVLAIFRLYDVTPYQMLCLDRTARTELKGPIDRLVKKGFLVRERRQDAYHLTRAGYAAVRQGK